MHRLPRKFIKEFLTIFRKQRCLWDSKSVHYNNRFKRAVAFKVLIEKYREIDPKATRDDVKRKLDSYRSYYRRELRKTTKAASVGQEYTTNLWYFKLLSFLHQPPNDSDIIEDAEFKEDLNDEENAYPEVAEDDEDPAEDLSLQDDSEQETPALSEQVFVTNARDVFDSVGHTVACKLRGLKTKQRIHAEKLISEVLYHAELENLDRHSTLLVTDPDDKLK